MDCTKKSGRKNQIIDGVVFTVMLAVIMAVTLKLFYMQTLGDRKSVV